LSEEQIAAAVARTGAHYDRVPYISYPATSLQPSRLAAVATLFGVSTPSVRTARTLEIGCASGGHLIPLAAAFPDAEFVGLDVSRVQIEAGQARLKRLGLSNIDLQCRSVTGLGSGDGLFDYIVCHGVYSWVPPAIRDAVLRVCREHLTENGVAVISYNVLPGWRMFQVVRDCMIVHAGNETDCARRAARVHELFEMYKTLTPDKLAYGQIWRNEAQRMAAHPDAYLAHELFEENNSPCTYSEFVSAAARHKLVYLGETDIRTMIPENIGAEAAKRIRESCDNEVGSAEQYIDTITGRTFRQTLLIRTERAGIIDRSMESARANQCYWLAGQGLKPAEAQNSTEFSFADGNGTLMTTSDPAIAQALTLLIERFPAASTIDQICPSGGSGQAKQQTLGALMKMLSLGMLTISTEPVHCAIGIPARPKAWFVCASDAAAGESATATLRHENFKIEPVARALLPLLDGNWDYGALTDNLFALLSSGAMTVRDAQGEAITEERRLRDVVARSTTNCLQLLAQAAILTPPT
jgi:methyltransferase-like protein/protein-L-isoaspartate O-methyltransferase